jgi:hypothetical protein
MRQLDEATNALSLLRVRDVDLKCTTFVVASSKVRPPTLRQPAVSEFRVGLSTRDLVRAAETVFNALSMEDQRRFNEMTGEQQVAFAGPYARLDQLLRREDLDDDTRGEIRTALEGVARAALANPDTPSVGGSVVGITSWIERVARAFLDVLSLQGFGDRGVAQTELKLPNVRVATLSLGQVAVALRTAATHPSMARFRSLVDDEMLNRLEAFSKEGICGLTARRSLRRDRYSTRPVI